MAGYVTQTRVNPSYKDWRGILYHRYGGSTYGSLSSAIIPPSQVTTSFRTGGASTTSVTSDDSDPTSYRDAFRGYRAEMNEKSRQHDTGHTFSSTKQWLEMTHSDVIVRGRYGVTYRGPLFCDPRSHLSGRSTSYPAPTTDSLGWYGTRAINKTVPTNSVASLATALAELKREGLPDLPSVQLWKERFHGLKRQLGASGSEHLNVEFGYKPLINDISKSMLAVSEAQRVLRQYERDSGRWVRRRYTFPSENSVTFSNSRSSATVPFWPVVNSTDWAYLFSGPTAANPVTLSETVTTSRKVWFSGAFTYFLGGQQGLLDAMKTFEQKINRLLGTRLTADVVWELAPWSWFGDWNANLGEIIANGSKLQSDGLVIRYGYLMCTDTTHRNVIVSGARDYLGNPMGDVVMRYVTETKRRVRAEPYGFGSPPGSYTSRQWAILAALGMTKSDRQIRSGD